MWWLQQQQPKHTVACQQRNIPPGLEAPLLGAPWFFLWMSALLHMLVCVPHRQHICVCFATGWSGRVLTQQPCTCQPDCFKQSTLICRGCVGVQGGGVLSCCALLAGHTGVAYSQMLAHVCSLDSCAVVVGAWQHVSCSPMFRPFHGCSITVYVSNHAHPRTGAHCKHMLCIRTLTLSSILCIHVGRMAWWLIATPHPPSCSVLHPWRWSHG